MDKIKLFTYIIITEIFIVGTLLLILFVNSGLNYFHNDKIIVSNNDIIYSKDKSVPFTGKMQDTLDNKLIVEFNVVNGIKQGEFSLLTLDGSFAVQGYMNKNKNDGMWKYYYKSGQLECIGNFDNDEPSGKWSWFYHNGSKRCEGLYINGKPEGQWIKYDEEGNTCAIIKYLAGEIISFVQIDILAKV
jgi:antitoxin component YwqK of YwqJK toxin-antitoxin module